MTPIEKKAEWTDRELVAFGWMLHYCTTDQSINIGTFIEEWEVVRLAVARTNSSDLLKKVMGVVGEELPEKKCVLLGSTYHPSGCLSCEEYRLANNARKQTLLRLQTLAKDEGISIE